MGNYLSAQEIRNTTSLVELLKKLGHSPVKQSGGEFFYLSVFRNERTASLCINDNLGVWYDHGGAGPSGIQGGNIIDFGLSYWYPADFSQVLGKISDVMGVGCLSEKPPHKRERISNQNAIKLPNYCIEDIKPLGSNFALSRYLQSRGVWGVAQNYLSEIHYYVEDHKHRKKNFFAAGWTNDSGGWEVRNTYFKGCLGTKDISFIKERSNRLLLFEGFIDFLSWKFDHEEERCSVIVLNSLNLLPRIYSRIEAYDHVEIFFDRDDAGRLATEKILQICPQAIDQSFLYDGFKDYNEKLVSEYKNLKQREGRSR